MSTATNLGFRTGVRELRTGTPLRFYDSGMYFERNLIVISIQEGNRSLYL